MEARHEWRPISVEEAFALGWHDAQDGTGTVTRAWDEWFFVDQDQRAWVTQSLKWATERYDAEWERIQSEPGDPDGPDPFDLLTTRMGGLLKHEYEWLTLSASVRDAVSAYEIHLAKAFDEVLASHGKRRRREDPTPNWKALSASFLLLGVDVRQDSVGEILGLRNVLTHKRGELRTADDRARFARHSGMWGDRLAHLDLATVIGLLDKLGRATRVVDPVAWAYSYGGKRVPILLKQ